MNSNTTKEGVTIDATPEPEPVAPEAAAGEPESAEPKPAEQPSAGNAGRGLAGLALLLAAAALGLTVAGGWYGYQQWQGLQTELAGLRSEGGDALSQARGLSERLGDLQGAQQGLGDQLSDLKSDMAQASGSVADVQRQFAEQQQLLTSERAQLDERETELRTLVRGLHERVGRSGTQWLIAEADYLINLADHRLRLARDPTTARAALALADQRLLATGDPGWAGVREQLARDITTLDTLARPDITGMWSRLGALIEQVPNLTLNDDPRQLRRGEAPDLKLATAEEERTWRTLLDDLWNGIKNAVRIRRNDEPVAAMLPPEQAYFVYENLRLKLQQGRLALVQGRADIYRESLQESRDWLTAQFATDPVSRAMDAALDELLAAPITVELPDLSTSVRAMQARRELLKSLPTPAPDEVDGDVEAPAA